MTEIHTTQAFSFMFINNYKVYSLASSISAGEMSRVQRRRRKLTRPGLWFILTCSLFSSNSVELTLHSMRTREGRKVHFYSEHQTLLIKLTEDFLQVGITSPFFSRLFVFGWKCENYSQGDFSLSLSSQISPPLLSLKYSYLHSKSISSKIKTDSLSQ